MAQNKKEEIFCFDASAFIRLKNFYGQDLIPEIWQELESLFINNKIISHEIVFNELTTSAKKDALSKWVSAKKIYFKKMSSTQVLHVANIVKIFPGLIDANNEKDQADPWLIALVLEEKPKIDLLTEEKEYIVVSEESIRSPHKIPAVCKYFGIKHFNLKEFFNYNNWQLSMRKL